MHLSFKRKVNFIISMVLLSMTLIYLSGDRHVHTTLKGQLLSTTGLKQDHINLRLNVSTKTVGVNHQHQQQQKHISQQKVASDSPTELKQDQMSQKKLDKDIPFILVICDNGAANSGQVKYAETLLKSAAMFTKTTLNFILVTSSKETYHHITNIVASWPHQYQQKLNLTHSPVWYPSNIEGMMKGIYRQCATEDILLPDMFSDLDAAIFVDTDMVFLRPPEDLWLEFGHFNDHEMVGMVPCITNSSKQLDFKCWNAGLILFNITRLKDFPGGWTQANLEVLDHHSHGLGDQDILNVLFKENPSYLHEVSCEWNYRRTQCQKGFNECPQATLRGISSLHGNAGTFHQDPLMKAVYSALQNHDLQASKFAETISGLEENVKTAILGGTPGYKFWCANATGIDIVFLQQLRNHLTTKT